MTKRAICDPFPQRDMPLVLKIEQMREDLPLAFKSFPDAILLLALRQREENQFTLSHHTLSQGSKLLEQFLAHISKKEV